MCAGRGCGRRPERKLGLVLASGGACSVATMAVARGCMPPVALPAEVLCHLAGSLGAPWKLGPWTVIQKRDLGQGTIFDPHEETQAREVDCLE